MTPMLGIIPEGDMYTNDKTTFVNASTCTAAYEPINKPIIIDLTEVDGKIIATYVED